MSERGGGGPLILGPSGGVRERFLSPAAPDGGEGRRRGAGGAEERGRGQGQRAGAAAEGGGLRRTEKAGVPPLAVRFPLRTAGRGCWRGSWCGGRAGEGRGRRARGPAGAGGPAGGQVPRGLPRSSFPALWRREDGHLWTRPPGSARGLVQQAGWGARPWRPGSTEVRSASPGRPGALPAVCVPGKAGGKSTFCPGSRQPRWVSDIALKNKQINPPPRSVSVVYAPKNEVRGGTR